MIGDSPTDIAAGRCLLGLPNGPDFVKTVEFQTRPTLRMLNLQLLRLQADFDDLLGLNLNFGYGMHITSEPQRVL